MNPLKELQRFGQSVWYDNISRGLIRSGGLKKLIEEDGVRGVTSNPTIFEKALSAGTEYDEPFRELVSQKKTIPEIFDALSVQDIQEAADQFGPLYEETDGQDGFVSLEVSPDHAHDAEKTVAEARRLWRWVNRPNVMIKIPATKEGLPAIERCLAEGINVNVTLIFAVERYGQVIDAYRSALEKRVREGKSVSTLASVASFFVSRIDTSVDKLLQERLQAAPGMKEKDALLEFLGKVAVANARAAYQLFKERFSGTWFRALAEKGARVQRPLWASTGTKNPNYSDVLYVEELIGPQTVNTMPLATLEAFRDHGKPRAGLEEKTDEARDVLERLKSQAGIDLKKVTAQLEAEGVKAFADSYRLLLEKLAAKKEAVEKVLWAAKS